MAGENSEFRYVNRVLGVQPRLGWFPASQLLPFGVSIWLAWNLKGLLTLGWLDTALVAAFFIAICWILIGERPWRLWLKFWSTPRFALGFVRYKSLLMIGGGEFEGEDWNGKREVGK